MIAGVSPPLWLLQQHPGSLIGSRQIGTLHASGKNIADTIAYKGLPISQAIQGTKKTLPFLDQALKQWRHFLTRRLHGGISAHARGISFHPVIAPLCRRRHFVTAAFNGHGARGAT
ncbi:MAG TPA: hypothetical protein VFX37_00845 [Pseudolabrys sp.]|nr:hypothetical protein [Pseudolabrys sp.]